MLRMPARLRASSVGKFRDTSVTTSTNQNSAMDEGVLRLLRDRDVVRANDRIRLTDLLSLWRETKLRHDDLVRSLTRLQSGGVIRIERDAGGASYVLSEFGALRVQAIPEGTPGVLFLIAITATDGEVPRRDLNYGRVGRQRRKSDPPPQSELPDIDPMA